MGSGANVFVTTNIPHSKFLLPSCFPIGQELKQVEIIMKDTAARSFNHHYELFIPPPVFGSPQTFIY